MRSVKVKVPESGVPALYVDGINGTLIGDAVSKIQCFLVESFTDTEEVRRVSVNITLPTLALVEFAMNLSRTIAERGEADLGPAMSQSAERLRKAIAGEMAEGPSAKKPKRRTQ